MTDLKEASWEQFRTQWPKRFRQGQHVTVIGPTGCGKTTLVTELVKPRAFVTVFGVKHKDESLAKLIAKKNLDGSRRSLWRKNAAM